jgi:lipid II:glycine glycyltransferase (peptidoglycan interpeptide bridge formation enzyme)
MLMPETFTINRLSNEDFDVLADSLGSLIIPLEQSVSWGSYDNSIPGRKFLGSFRYDDNGLFVALASATLYRQRGRDWIWIKHGPVYASVPNSEIVKKMCLTLKQQFKVVDGIKPAFIRLSSPTFSAPLVKPFEHTMYDQTVVLDLTQDEDSIWFGMSQTARQEIKKAEKDNVTYNLSSHENSADYFEKNCYPLLLETAQRSSFGIHPVSVYLSMLEHLPQARLYTATKGSQVIAWAIITTYRGRALYYYGASGESARNNGAAYYLQWQIIKQLKQNHISAYDLMGIAGKHFPALKNVTGFKMKFSKNIVDVPMAYDLPLKPIKYTVISKIIKAKRTLNKNRN